MINLDDYNDYPMGDEKTYQNMKKYGSSVHPNSSAAKHSQKRKEMASKMKHKIDKKYHPTDSHKELGNKVFNHHASEGRTQPVDEYLKMTPDERRKVNTHMGRLHRRKNK